MESYLAIKIGWRRGAGHLQPNVPQQLPRSWLPAMSRECGCVKCGWLTMHLPLQDGQRLFASIRGRQTHPPADSTTAAIHTPCRQGPSIARSLILPLSFRPPAKVRHKQTAHSYATLLNSTESEEQRLRVDHYTHATRRSLHVSPARRNKETYLASSHARSFVQAYAANSTTHDLTTPSPWVHDQRTLISPRRSSSFARLMRPSTI